VNQRLRIVAAGLVLVIGIVVFGAAWWQMRELDRELRPLEKLGLGKPAGIAIDRELK
jgi:hypothetical protein